MPLDGGFHRGKRGIVPLGLEDKQRHGSPQMALTTRHLGSAMGSVKVANIEWLR